MIVLGKPYGKRPFKDLGLDGKWILHSVLEDVNKTDIWHDRDGR
jgi:hypothetical protein